METIFVIKLWYNELSGNSNVHPTRLTIQIILLGWANIAQILL